MERVIPFIVLPNKKDQAGNYQFFKVLGTWQHSRGANGEDPFAAVEDRTAADQTADSRAEAEREARAEEVREQNRVEAQAREDIEEVSPEKFGFGDDILTEQDAPF